MVPFIGSPMSAIESNFHSIEAPDGQLYRLGALADRHSQHEPASRLIMLGQLANLPVELATGRCSLPATLADGYSKAQRRLSFEWSLPREVGDLLHCLRVLCIQAAQDGMNEDGDSLQLRQLATCYVRSCHDAALKLGHIAYVRQATV